MLKLLPILLLGLAACGPPWAVIVQSGPPSALAGAQMVTVETDLNMLMVNGRTYAQEMAQRSPEEQASMQDAMTSMETGLRTMLATDIGVPIAPAAAPPQPGEVRLTVRYISLDPGKYAFVYARDTQLTTRLVWSVGGQVVDEIETHVVVDAGHTRPAIIQRMNMAGDQTGRLAARFFRREQTR